MSGFFIFHKNLYKKNKRMFFGKGFKILIDLIINSKKNIKTKDVLINFKRRYESKSKMNFKILFILIHFYFLSCIKKLIN